MTTTTLYHIIKSELLNNGHSEFLDKNNRLVLFDEDYQVMEKVIKYDNDVSVIVDKLFSGMFLDDPVHDNHFKRAFVSRFFEREINRQTVDAFRMKLLSVFMQNEKYINRVYSDMEKYIIGETLTDATGEQLNEQEQSENSKQNTKDNTTASNSENTKQDTKDNTTSSNSENTKQDTKDNTTSSNSENTKQSDTQEITGNTTTDNRNARTDLPQDAVNINVNDDTLNSASENEITKNQSDNSQNTTGENTGETTGESQDERIGESTGETTGESQDERIGEMTGERSGESQDERIGEMTGERSGNSKGKTDTTNNTINRSYKLDELFKSSMAIEHILDRFDRKCFMQTW